MELSTQMNVFEELLVQTKQETTDDINTNYNNLSFNGGFDHHHHPHQQLFPNGWNIDYLCFNNEEEDENTLLYSSSFMDLISQPPPLLLHQTPLLPPPSASSPPLTSSVATTFDYPFFEALQEIIGSSSPSPPLMLPTSQEDSFINPTSYPSPLMESDQSKSFSVGYCGGETTNKKKSKKLEGQPSKNLMAERRRRKRLNDRLSMLRSIVPKISKMDRTSILGDAIDYMKELLDKINKLQEEEQELGNSNGSHHSKLFGDIKDLNTNEPMVRNSPKFEVDRRVVDTRVDICCSPKPGLLLSTVNTLETLGLEIEQCVISCFSDFSLQASCSEAAQQRDFITSEDIKQALFRNAGYGGNCL
ncbi:hypothetical protein BRARA_F02431 [Brassica rapa]|uniref:BHLH domain-containing protein n=2 Tax=Brassica campestris TaxID=3711 RepID=A0A397Z0F8_BRACM|nr:hypothetical protein IGI04_024092 [Brassica rapa subsp. trilocularis]RID59187.1 hypothetical protein BRARA_F02431 [Brassica rapa]